MTVGIWMMEKEYTTKEITVKNIIMDLRFRYYSFTDESSQSSTTYFYISCKDGKEFLIRSTLNKDEESPHIYHINSTSNKEHENKECTDSYLKELDSKIRESKIDVKKSIDYITNMLGPYSDTIDEF